MKTYLIQTKFNTYKYQRRVPKQLVKYIDSNYFRVSLGADTTEATSTALHYNSLIDEALQLCSLGISDDIIVHKLEVLIPKPVQKKQSEQLKEGAFLDVVSGYLKSTEQTLETTNKDYFYNKVCPPIFKYIGLTDNPVLKDIDYNHLLKFRDIILQLPKKTLLKYRSMEVGSILKILDDITSKDKLSTVTVNKYIKWLRTLFSFALVRGLITVNLPKAIPTQSTIDDKLQRLPLSDIEYKEIISNLTNGRFSHITQSIEKQYLVQVAKFTGLRLSEIYKCKIETIEGVLCFSLLDRSIKLKTKSSYRAIPIHSSLLNDVNNFYNYRNTITALNLSESVNKIIKKHNFKDSHKKSLYSLRHSFATDLITKGANNVLVSQLLGHSLANLGGMTLTRYASGHSINQLQEVVELLKD